MLDPLQYVGLTQGPDSLLKMAEEVRAELDKAKLSGKVFVRGLGPGQLTALIPSSNPLGFTYMCDDGDPRPRPGDYLVLHREGDLALFKVVETSRRSGRGEPWDHFIECRARYAGHRVCGQWCLPVSRRRPWWIRIPAAAAAPFVWMVHGAKICARTPIRRKDLLAMTLLFTPVFGLMSYVIHFDNPTIGIIVACLGFAPQVGEIFREGFLHRGG